MRALAAKGSREAIDISATARDRFGAALVCVGLFVLLIGLKTDQNMRNELVVSRRWQLLVVVVTNGGTGILREMGFLTAAFGDGFSPEQYRMLLLDVAMVVVWKPRGFARRREPPAFFRERKFVAASLTGEGHG